MAFPCNQFGAQEPGTPEQIQAVARDRYGATFPLFAKVDVNGERAHSVWKFLKGADHGKLLGDIKWNFAKFLVDRDGFVRSRYMPQTAPSSIEADIRAALDADAVCKDEL